MLMTPKKKKKEGGVRERKMKLEKKEGCKPVIYKYENERWTAITARHKQKVGRYKKGTRRRERNFSPSSILLVPILKEENKKLDQKKRKKTKAKKTLSLCCRILQQMTVHPQVGTTTKRNEIR